jgi:hypothetical protein
MDNQLFFQSPLLKVRGKKDHSQTSNDAYNAQTKG